MKCGNLNLWAEGRGLSPRGFDLDLDYVFSSFAWVGASHSARTGGPLGRGCAAGVCPCVFRVSGRGAPASPGRVCSLARLVYRLRAFPGISAYVRVSALMPRYPAVCRDSPRAKELCLG